MDTSQQTDGQTQEEQMDVAKFIFFGILYWKYAKS